MTSPSSGCVPVSGRHAFSRLAFALFGLLVPATAPGAVDATVSPATLPLGPSASATVQISGLDAASGAFVLVERFLDANANGVVDPGEVLVESHILHDGVVPGIGGARNINVPGDEDGVANGSITYRVEPGAGSELGRLAGPQLLRISSLTSSFPPFTRSLTLTHPAAAQSISGTIRNGDTPVPHAMVIVLQPMGDDVEFLVGAHADAQGNYTLGLPAPGEFLAVAMHPSYVSGFDLAQVVILESGQAEGGIDLGLLSPTTSITGRVTFSGTSEVAMGLQIIAENEDGYLIVTSTTADGTYTIPAVAGVWGISTSDRALLRLGCLIPENDFDALADTTAGAATGVDFQLTRGTAMVHGRITGPGGVPVAGIELGANSGNGDFVSYAYTNADGYYSIVTGPGEWNLWFNEEMAGQAGYLPPSGSTLTFGSYERWRAITPSSRSPRTSAARSHSSMSHVSAS